MYARVPRSPQAKDSAYTSTTLAIATPSTPPAAPPGRRARSGRRGQGAAALGALRAGRRHRRPRRAVAIGVAAGPAPTRSATRCETGAYLDAVHADIRQAQAIGVTGVPFFVLDDSHGVSGAQPTALFAQALDQAWRESHPLAMVTTPAGNDTHETGACGPDGCPI